MLQSLNTVHNKNKCVGKHDKMYRVKVKLLKNFFFSGGLHLWHMEVPRSGVELELQLTAQTTTTAMGSKLHL